VVTEAGKAMAEKLGYPTVVDYGGAKDPLSAERYLHVNETDSGQSGFSSRRYMRAYVEAIHYYKTH